MKLGNGQEIVVVDDDPIDIRITKRAHERSAINNEIITFDGGEAFLEYLAEVEAGSRPMPALVLIDINMPGKSGFDVLKAVRSRDAFAKVPLFVVFSNSDRMEDREKSLQLGANGFSTKDELYQSYEMIMTKFAAS